MTDKEILEAVKAEIERLHEEHRGSKGDWYYRLALRSILYFIKTLQVEPTNPSVDEAMAEIERKAKLFTEANKGKTSEEILAEMRCEEPVNEGLEEESKEWLRPQLDKSYAAYGETKQMELTHFDGYAMLDAIEFGANWQKKKYDIIGKDLEEAAKHYLYSNILYDDVYIGNPTDKDCIEMFKAGAEWQFERVKEALLSEVLPCFMHGGEADEVVAKLEEVLNQKK